MSCALSQPVMAYCLSLFSADLVVMDTGDRQMQRNDAFA